MKAYYCLKRVMKLFLNRKFSVGITFFSLYSIIDWFHLHHNLPFLQLFFYQPRRDSWWSHVSCDATRQHGSRWCHFLTRPELGHIAIPCDVSLSLMLYTPMWVYLFCFKHFKIYCTIEAPLLFLWAEHPGTIRRRLSRFISSMAKLSGENWSLINKVFTDPWGCLLEVSVQAGRWRITVMLCMEHGCWIWSNTIPIFRLSI